MNDPMDHYERRIERAVAQMADSIDVVFTENPFRALSKRFIIACSARTGSNLLCQHLLAHGAVAMECFAPDEIVAKCREKGIPSLQAYCEQHLDKNALEGIFGVKGWSAILAPLVQAGEFPRHRHDWQFIHLTRTDTLKQAISFVIAEQSRAWQSFHSPVKKVSNEDFDAQKIAGTIAGFNSRNKEWEDIFQMFDIDPLRITYEQLAADPEGTTAAVASFLGLEGPPISRKRFVQPHLEVQATNLNARWEKRFLRLRSES